METITINTYDLETRFGLNDEDAKKFLQYTEQEAIKAEYKVEFTTAISVDQSSEDFVSKCFENYYF